MQRDYCGNRACERDSEQQQLQQLQQQQQQQQQLQQQQQQQQQGLKRIFIFRQTP